MGPEVHNLEALDAGSGRRLWTAFVGEKNLVPLVRGGLVYVATYAGRGTVQARNARTGALAWRVRLGADALALGRDRLYAGGETGKVFALRLGR